jgi:hypothetical protein
MKAHPRIRKTIKWGGVVVTALLVVVWIGSGWWVVGWNDGWERAIRIEAGCVDVWGRQNYPEGKPGHGVWCYRHSFQLRWTAGRIDDGFVGSGWGRRFGWRIPLWIAVGVFGGLTYLAWYFDRRAQGRDRMRRCPKCNYDRAGIAAGAVCPECGAGPKDG